MPFGEHSFSSSYSVVAGGESCNENNSSAENVTGSAPMLTDASTLLSVLQDNLPSFEACPSVDGNESVCNSVLDLETGAFTASCGAIACVGA